MNNEMQNDEGLLSDGELETVAGGGPLLKAAGKFLGKLAGPLSILLDILDSKPAY